MAGDWWLVTGGIANLSSEGVEVVGGGGRVLDEEVGVDECGGGGVVEVACACMNVCICTCMNVCICTYMRAAFFQAHVSSWGRRPPPRATTLRV